MRPALGFLALHAIGAWAFDEQQDTKGQDGQDGFLLHHHTLRKPFLDANMQIPNWAFKGDAVVTKNFVRLTADKQSKRGSLWNYVPQYYHNWELEFEFKVYGEAPRLYGDGFVFWYTKDWGVDGGVFANQDLFSGMALFFDTYSNHQGEHNHGHPYVSAMINDGTKKYDHDADGTHTELAGCQASFRGKEHPTKARISYVNRTLTVDLDYRGYNTWQRCFQEKGVDLPTGYHYGFSAVTGALSDNHDIHWVRVLAFPDAPAPEGQPAEDYSKVVPKTERLIEDRPRVDAAQPTLAGRVAYKGLQVFFYVGLVLALVVAVVFVVRAKMRERDMKRF